MLAAAGMVSTQAQMMRPVTPQRTDESFVVAPTPTIAPVMTCVVETGMPQSALRASVVAPAVSTALNGGPMFKFNESISFQVSCETQEEVDYYWDKLSEGGDRNAQQCGWLKDKYGASWQVVPNVLPKMLADPDAEKSQRVMKSMLQMKKLDIEELKRAYDG